MGYSLQGRQATDTFELDLSLGDIGGYAGNRKFGYNGAVSSTEETIWDQGGLYAYLGAAATLTVSSSDANDTSAGTGARTVQIYGLDTDYLEIDETVTLNGQTAVNTASEYLRINRAVVRTAGSGAINAGVLYAGTGTVTSGVPANVFTTVQAGEGQTLQAFYTIPAGKEGYIKSVGASMFGNQNVFVTVRFVARPDGEVFQTKDKFTVSRATVEVSQNDVYAAKTDLEMRGASSGADVDLSAQINIVLKDI